MSSKSKTSSSQSRSRSPVQLNHPVTPPIVKPPSSQRSTPPRTSQRSRSRSPVNRDQLPSPPQLTIPRTPPPTPPPPPLSQPNPPQTQPAAIPMDVQMPKPDTPPPMPTVRRRRVRKVVPPSDRTLRSHTKRDKPDDNEDISIDHSSKKVKINSLDVFISFLSPDQIRNLSDEAVDTIIKHMSK